MLSALQRKQFHFLDLFPERSLQAHDKLSSQHKELAWNIRHSCEVSLEDFLARDQTITVAEVATLQVLNDREVQVFRGSVNAIFFSVIVRGHVNRLVVIL